MYRIVSKGGNEEICSALFQLLHRVLILQELIRGDHRDAIPRADLVAERAADAAGEVDRADLKRQLVAWAGNEADTVHRADGHARLAAGAHVFIEEGEDLGELLFGHFGSGAAGQGRDVRTTL
jgi:hypothetical protein